MGAANGTVPAASAVADSGDSYLEELRVNWRSLGAVCLGMSCGYALTQYITSIFAPHLLHAFNWSKAQFSLVGTTLAFGIITHVIAGRLTDVLGVRVMATAGVIAMPLIYIGYSAMTGNFAQYFWLTSVLIIWAGNTTVSSTYGRLIAERFVRTRGLAIAMANCSPAVIAALAVPSLSRFIEAHGWRAGYLAVAAFSGVGGVCALALMPRSTGIKGAGGHASHRSTAKDYSAILRSRAFQFIVIGMLLSNLPFMVQFSQLSVILLDRGMSTATASFMVSLFAIGVVAGNLICGIAVDRLAAHVVTSLTVCIYGIALATLAAGPAIPIVLEIAVLLLGAALGAEFALVLFLSMWFFEVDIFSTVATLIGTAVALSGIFGSVLLSVLIKQSGTFMSFLLVSAAGALAGSVIFLLLGRSNTRGALAKFRS